jgi:hypothetical protein
VLLDGERDHRYEADAQEWVFGVTKPFDNFGAPGIDFYAVLSSQRKNLDALTQINQLAVEGMQTIARHQLKIMQRAIKHASALFRDWTHPVALDGRMAKMSRLRNRRSRRASSAPAS